MRFKARLREMAASEISEMIDAATLARIKAQDPHPLFKAFVVGHEGEARGVMLGVGNIVKRWFRNAIESLHDKIQTGLQLFHGHAQGTNDQAGRSAIGEVVGKRAMRIGERLSSVVACYIFPSFRHLPLDVASIEAEVDMDQDPKRGLYVAGVDRVTGIALGSSQIETPGFEGATLLGTLQAFAESKKGDNLMDLTLEDVRAFLAQEKAKPSDLFSPDVLAADPIIASMREKSPSNFEFARMRRELTDAEKRLAEIEREKATLAEKVKIQDAEISASRLETAKSKAASLFEKQKTDRKLDDRQAKFIQNRLARFIPTKPEEIDKEFNAYLDAEIDEYGKIAKEVFGIEPGAPANGGGKKAGAEPEQNRPPQADKKHLDPTQNPMIKIG